MVSLLYHIKLKYTFFVKNVLAKNTVLKIFLFDFGNLLSFFFLPVNSHRYCANAKQSFALLKQLLNKEGGLVLNTLLIILRPKF